MTAVATNYILILFYFPKNIHLWNITKQKNKNFINKVNFSFFFQLYWLTFVYVRVSFQIDKCKNVRATCTAFFEPGYTDIPTIWVSAKTNLRTLCAMYQNCSCYHWKIIKDTIGIENFSTKWKSIHGGNRTQHLWLKLSTLYWLSHLDQQPADTFH